MIQHIVLFTPKGTLSAETRRAFARMVLETLRKSPHIARWSVGRRTAVDPGYERSFGDTTYEYAAVLEFETKAQLVSYLTDRDHNDMGGAFWQYCDRTVVCEVEAFDGMSADASVLAD